MKFDDLDLEIFDTFLKNGQKEFTSTYIANELYDLKNRDITIQKTNAISYRLKKWCKNKVMTEKKKENISYYSFNSELITIGDSNLEIEGKKKNFGKAMMIELPDGAYLVKFFDEEK